MAAEVPEGTDRAAVLKWAADRSIPLKDSAAHPHVLMGAAEYVQAKSLVCKGYSISLEITLDANNAVVQKEAKPLGNCLL